MQRRKKKSRLTKGRKKRTQVKRDQWRERRRLTVRTIPTYMKGRAMASMRRASFESSFTDPKSVTGSK